MAASTATEIDYKKSLRRMQGDQINIQKSELEAQQKEISTHTIKPYSSSNI
jgi:hypothetical protein